MKYIKTYKKLYEWYFHDEFHKDKIRDVNYYLNRIKSENVSLDSIESLFHWSCTQDFPELAIALVDILGVRILKLNRSIAYLKYDAFKKIIETNDLYKKLSTKDIIDNVIYYGGDDADKKLEYLQKLGFELKDENLRSACVTNNLKTIKYLIKIGLDPKKIEKEKYSTASTNCLDIVTKYNRSHDEGVTNIIDYFVNQLNIPVTYRHMYNILNKGILTDYEAFEILMKSKNRVEDYSYSSYATQDEDKHQIIERDVLRRLSGKDKMNYFKYLVDRSDEKNKYNYVYCLNLKKDWKGFNIKSKEYIDPKHLDMAYYLVKQSKTNPHSGFIELLMNENQKFWFDKMKSDKDLILKLWDMPYDIKQSYEYQKIIFESKDELTKRFIKENEKNIHEKILREYDDLPEILELIAKKYNL